MRAFMTVRSNIIASLADACCGTELRLVDQVRELPYTDAAHAIDAWVEALGGHRGLVAEAQRAAATCPRKDITKAAAWESAISMMRGLLVHLVEEVAKRRRSCPGCDGHGDLCSRCGGMRVVFDVEAA